ncbi:MAG: hypothetical protein HYZ26_00610 [Chloroflexi bacterium]|nr:hypothetical protein [Chloroflexota bacterium]
MAASRLWKVLALLAAISLACRVGGGPAETPPAETPPPAVTAAPTEVPEGMLRLLNDQGEEIFVPEPTPELVADMLDRVEAGEITLEEGVIAALRVMVGETSLEELSPDGELVFRSGWGLTALAAEAYAGSTDEAAKAEIRRLLEILIPTQERLDRYAMPEEEARNAAPGRLAAPRRMQVPCASIWPRGFPEDVADPPVCLLYRTETVGGSTFRIYYPEERRGDAAFLAYVDAAMQALLDSRAAYDPLSGVHNINLIFTLLESPLESAAEVPVLDDTATGHRTCPISVFPVALEWGIDDFKQAVAHEVWHCVQFWRLGFNGYSTASWMAEGTAEYFSNVVYPENNLEHRFVEDFNILSTYTSILDMTYENSVFFQYLGSRFGSEYIVRLIDAVGYAVESQDAQAAALAGYGDMQTTFHQFGQAYLTDGIIDTGGSPLPINLYFLDENTFPIGAGREVFMSTAPITLQRYILLFEEGREYTVARSTDGEPGRDTWRAPAPASFTEISPTLRLTCESDPRRLVLLTSLPPSPSLGSQSELTLNFTRAEGDAALMDCCLVGTWEQGTDVIRQNLEIILPPEMTIVNVTGRFLLVLTAEGTSTFTPQDYGATVRTRDGQTATVRVEGTSIGTFTIPELGSILSTGESTSLLETITVAGVSTTIPLDSSSAGPFSGGAFTYTCDDSTLVAYIPPGLAPFPTSTYTRISSIPEEPEEGEEFEPPPSEGGGAPPPDIGPAGGACTQVVAADFAASGSTAVWTFDNQSGETMEIDSITLNWPAENGSLTGIAIGGETVWTGSLSSTPAFIESGWVGAAALRTLPTGAETELEFTFSGASVAPGGYVVVLRFTNGCLVSDPR